MKIVQKLTCDLQKFTENPDFKKVQEKQGKGNVYVIRQKWTSNTTYGLVRLNPIERLAKSLGINPLKYNNQFKNRVKFISPSELKILSHVTYYKVKNVRETHLHKDSVILKTITDFASGKEQAKLFIRFVDPTKDDYDGWSAPEAYQIIFRKEDGTPLDKDFITSTYVKEMQYRDKKLEHKEKVGYNLYAKSPEGDWSYIGRRNNGAMTEIRELPQDEIPDLDQHGNFELVGLYGGHEKNICLKLKI